MVVERERGKWRNIEIKKRCLHSGLEKHYGPTVATPIERRKPCTVQPFHWKHGEKGIKKKSEFGS